MSFIPGNENDPFFLDYSSAKDLGKDLQPAYAKAEPFSHIVIDDFLPESVVSYCLENFPTKLDPNGVEFDRAQEKKKRSYHPDYLQPRLRGLFYAFNSRPFIKVVENITGIKGLVPDPYFLGAGFHEIQNGGHLSMHADFNHHRPMDLERRVNVLIYLNEGWKEEYGGQLELWSTDMKERVQSIVPIVNRCVMFTTTGESMHGNPEMVNHPSGVSRKSIALYYYTSTWNENLREKTTQFKTRPSTQDVFDWSVKADEIMTEYLPPFLSRKLLGLRRKLIT